MITGLRKIFRSSCPVARFEDLSFTLPRHFRTRIADRGAEWVQLTTLAELLAEEARATVHQYSLTASREPPVFYARDGGSEDAVRGKAGTILKIISATTSAELPPEVMAAISVRTGLITPGQASGDILIDPRTQEKVIRFVHRRQFLGLWAEIAFSRGALEEISRKQRTRTITRVRHTDRPTITGVYLA